MRTVAKLMLSAITLTGTVAIGASVVAQGRDAPAWALLQALDARIASAQRAGDPSAEAAALRARLAASPDNPRVLLELADLLLAQGESAAAQTILRRYEALGLTFDASRHPSLARLALPSLTASGGSKRPPKPVAELGPGLIVAEGVADDPRRSRILVSAVAARSILAVSDTGTVSRFLTGEPRGGLFGMAIAPMSDSLWVAEASGPDIPGPVGAPATALMQVRLADGAILRRVAPPTDGDPHALNDVAVGPDGSVYAADARSGVVYRLRPGGDTLEILAPKGWFGSAQGLAPAADGRALIVADYAAGLYRIDLRSGAIAPLRPRAPAALVGLDGLARCGGGLIATQNGVAPERILRIRLGRDARALGEVAVLAQGDGVHDITLGACRGRRFWFVAESQWASLDGPPKQAARPPRLMVLDTTPRDGRAAP